MNKRSVFVFFLLTISLFCSSCQADSGSPNPIQTQSSANSEQPQTLPTVQTNLGKIPLKIMLARTNTQKAQGLMFYESLPDNEGMLFVYSSPRMMSFWMYNTKIPLDLIFLSDQLEVTEWIESMTPGYGIDPAAQPRYESQIPAQYALELNSGSVKKLGISPGDRLEIPLTLLYSD